MNRVKNAEKCHLDLNNSAYNIRNNIHEKYHRNGTSMCKT